MSADNLVVLIPALLLAVISGALGVYFYLAGKLARLRNEYAQLETELGHERMRALEIQAALEQLNLQLKDTFNAMVSSFTSIPKSISFSANRLAYSGPVRSALKYCKPKPL